MANVGGAGDATLLEDQFTVTSFNQTKYDRVARIGAESLGGKEIAFTLDINTELYPMKEGEHFHLLLATTLNLDGSKDESRGWRDVGRGGPGGESSLADMYDYVCYGRLYKFDDDERNGDSIKAFISFGGLLLAITGPYKRLTPLNVDNLYMLIKK